MSRNNQTGSNKAKKKYAKPSLRSEKLTAVAAVCNGTSTTAGRKASTGAPNFCSSTKLKS